MKLSFGPVTIANAKWVGAQPLFSRARLFENQLGVNGINEHIGRHPIAAFGNSDGDQQMLQYTKGRSGARFALLVHHTDAMREWAYDRGSSIGRLDKALDEATARGWTVVDMKSD